MNAAAKAQELKCGDKDLSCLCKNNDFVYGFRDCAKAICDADGVSKILAYATSICKSAGVTINPGSGSDGNGGNGGNNGGNGGNNGGASGSGGASGGAGVSSSPYRNEI